MVDCLFHTEKFKTFRPEETVDDKSQDIGAIYAIPVHLVSLEWQS